MKSLVLYFNELSAPPGGMPPELEADWKTWTLELFACLQQVSRHQPDVTMALPTGHWHELCGAKPLSAWVREWLGRTEYQRLLPRLRNVCPMDSLDTDVYFNNQKAVGLSFSHLVGSWAFSFPVANSDWLSSSITASACRLEGEDIAEQACEIQHVANCAHATRWQQNLVDWGRGLTEGNTIGELANYPIQMYPLDHGYPHVHLVDPQRLTPTGRPKTLAKYRIDRFERMEGPPSWDNDMRSWIERHTKLLLSSWGRCQRGQHPYRIMGDGL
ncbi:hypothetical protein [Aromatoleum bremense]|uniref:Uncharacterized protein n=1 Tax=Aromatoleum bremense TaxID=76115 RepID=A0ABX1NR55_9RHOO|nr:hypothetical protein [Aromatoleum bremense]NMG14474.1 hypothetical protein [Aromatoleum bremense]QTQ30808.1 Uncharacterized protein pbN1_08160 [Aromatoleum bremense]